MNRVKIIKILGLLGALLTAGASAVGGDFLTAGGIISAALSSAKLG